MQKFEVVRKPKPIEKATRRETDCELYPFGYNAIVRILFHTSSSGRSYIEGFLNELTIEARATVLAVFNEIRNYGLSAIGCEFRQIEGKLWEIKIRTASGGYRFFYAMLSGDTMYVLHAYRKQGQKAPKQELEIARKRLKEVLS